MGCSRWWQLGLAAMLGCGLSVSGSPADPSPTRPTAGDASMGAQAETGALDDAGATTAPDAGCDEMIADDFATLDRWAVVGTASLSADGGGVTLVKSNTSYEAGGVWLKEPRRFGDVDITFRIRVDHNGSYHPSDGFAMVWGESADGKPLLLSWKDRALGVPDNVKGYGLALDTYLELAAFFRPDPARGKPGTYSWEIGSTRSFVLPVNAWNDVRVMIRERVATISVATFGFTEDAGAAYLPIEAAHLGFVAHSGAAGDGFHIAALKVTFLPCRR